MEQLENKIKQGRNSAIRLGIGLGVAITGYIFDYGSVDEIMRIGGVVMMGLNTQETANYIRYSFKKNKE